jgi:hypothetical protein
VTRSRQRRAWEQTRRTARRRPKVKRKNRAATLGWLVVYLTLIHQALRAPTRRPRRADTPARRTRSRQPAEVPAAANAPKTALGEASARTGRFADPAPDTGGQFPRSGSHDLHPPRGRAPLDAMIKPEGLALAQPTDSAQFPRTECLPKLASVPRDGKPIFFGWPQVVAPAKYVMSHGGGCRFRRPT